MQELAFSAEVRIWTTDKAPASWHFVHVDKKIGAIIKESVSNQQKKRGRWSVRVEARIAFYTWKTSLFPHKETGSYILPLKKEVRKELRIEKGTKVYVELRLL